MKTAIIVHGMPSKAEYDNPDCPAPSNNHWFPWLQRQLLLRGILAQTPEMPIPYAPVYHDWRRVFEQFQTDEETILVGHSCGAGFLAHWLSETKTKVGRVALVAPYLDPDHDGEADRDFFNFKLDPGMSAKTGGLSVFVSKDDDKDIIESARMIKAASPETELFEFTDKGHFVASNMPNNHFPELLTWLVK